MDDNIIIDRAAAEAARQRLLSQGRPVWSAEELQRPPRRPGDAEDLEVFLAILNEERRQSLVEQGGG